MLVQEETEEDAEERRKKTNMELTSRSLKRRIQSVLFHISFIFSVLGMPAEYYDKGELFWFNLSNFSYQKFTRARDVQQYSEKVRS